MHCRTFWLCLAALCPMLAFGAAGAQDQLAHAIFLKVNNRTITREMVAQAYHYLIVREYKGIPPEDQEELEKLEFAALRDLVRTFLIHDEAAALNLKPDRASSRRAQERSGLSPEEITPTVRRMLEADDLFEMVMMASGTPIRDPSPREIKAFYNKHRDEFKTNAYIIVRTIFIGADTSRAQSYFKDRAEKLMSDLQAVPLERRTEAFDKAAKEVSQDIFAEFGGLLTGNSPERWIPKDFDGRNADGEDIFPPQMTEEIRRLNHKGELRLAVSRDGMHILYCEDVRDAKVVPWDEASRIIEYVLKQRAKDARMRVWMEKVFDRSDVRWHDGARFERELLSEILLPSERISREQAGFGD